MQRTVYRVAWIDGHVRKHNRAFLMYDAAIRLFDQLAAQRQSGHVRSVAFSQDGRVVLSR